MDVTAWLQSLGLERYVPAFIENRIEADILPSLTVEDLKDLGVTLVGDRRRLLDAIAALGVAVPPAAALVAAPDAPASAAAERRQLTVMFCDLVGSTSLSTRFDPEDLREVISAYHHAVAATIAGFDGFVAKYMGDGVLIYFGYPQAHEDDAERSVRAGLATIGAVARLDLGSAELQVRVGIATGLVVVGDLIGEGSAQEQSVVGETPNLAARLQTLAAPASLVIAASTRQQIGELFNLEDLGLQQLAGFAEQQRVWRVLAESGEVNRFDALRSGTTPLVGRDEEVALLLRRWQQAKTGEGRVVLISGEPGIGKSRLTAALFEHIGTEPHRRLCYFCLPHHQDSALYPIIAQLERAAGFARDDTVAVRLDKLRALLAPGSRDEDDIALLSELMSLPSSATELAHHLTAAGNPERAVDQWLKAGRYAAAKFAYPEAIAHFNRGLGLLHSLPESQVRDSREIEVQLALGLCVLATKGGVEAKPPYARAHELAAGSGEPRQRFEALYGVWQSTFISGEISAASPFSERLIGMAEREGDDGLRLQAHHSGWATWYWAGDSAKALEHADVGRRLYNPKNHASHRLVYGGHDPGVCAGYVAAQAEWMLGYPAKALASITASLALAERVAHPFTLSLALTNATVVFLNRREPERALSHLDGAKVLAAEQRLSLVYEPSMLRGMALLGQDAVEEAIASIREGVTRWTQLGRTYYLPYGFAFLAEGLALHGDRAAALTTLRKGLETASATGEHMWDAELHRLTGTVLLAENKIEEGQACLQQAIHIAQAQQAKALELRAAANLARLWGEQSRRAEARDLLAPIYGWFTEGFDTADLKEAKALLEELT